MAGNKESKLQEKKKDKKEHAKATKASKKEKKKDSHNAPALYHWADQLVERIIRIKGDKKQYTIASGITPSGTIHVGNFREIITVELVARAFRSRKKKVRFIYSWDNYDVFRKVPKNMPKQDLLKTFLRKPIVDTPDTHDCKHESYARHNEVAVEESLPRVGIKTEFIYQSKKYRNCDYADDMKKALQNAKTIKKLLDEFRKEPLPNDWLPISIFCEKCGRDTTKATNYDGKFGVRYTCECGHEDTFSLKKKGIAKLPWRIDWPMRWNYESVDFEPAGKDHSTVGGSRDTGVKIQEHVWKTEAPVYQGYDFLRIKGGMGKMSSSSGELVTLSDVLDLYEPEIVRWLFAGTKPLREFAISFDLDVLKVYEDFDKCERIFFGEQKVKNEKEEHNQKRIYELSMVKEGWIPKHLPFQTSFRHLTNVLLMNDLDVDKAISYYEKQLKDAYDKQKLRTRAECAVYWLKNYAPPDFVYEIQKNVSSTTKKRLTATEKKALHDLAKALKDKKNWSEQDLHDECYAILTNHELTSKEFFRAAYSVLINKERGPKLAAFLLELGDRAVKLFEKV
jgi:lysyl-tRNA synthetase, class I